VRGRFGKVKTIPRPALPLHHPTTPSMLCSLPLPGGATIDHAP
jgi:hypothetical protein